MPRKKATKKATRKAKPKPPPGLWVEYMPLEALQGAPRNPKLHHPDLGTSVQRFGFNDPPILNEATGLLLAGHGRRDDLLARKEAGEDRPQNVRLARGGGWLVPVTRGVSIADPREAEAFLLAHNRVGEAGGWDPAGLAEIVAGLGKVEAQGLGWDPSQLEEIVAALPTGWGDGEPGGRRAGGRRGGRRRGPGGWRPARRPGEPAGRRLRARPPPRHVRRLPQPGRVERAAERRKAERALYQPALRKAAQVRRVQRLRADRARRLR